MSPERQRIKIAEACGWYAIRQGAPWEVSDAYSNPELIGFHDSQGKQAIPDFCNDLNAMHEAETWLCEKRPDAAYAYDQKWLPEVTGAYQDAGLLNTLRLWHATAAQRAEAFLRALNLWEESA